MRISDLLLVCAAAALPLGAQVIATREDWHGVQIYFDAKLEPPPARTTDPAVLRRLEREVNGGVICGNGVHRFWKDEEQKEYLGYDVSVEPGRGPQVFQLRIAPLSLTPRAMAEFGLPEAWKRLSLPKYPVIPAVRVGDTVAFDLVANPSNGRKLVDYLTLQRTKPPAVEPPRDFSLADADLTVDDPRLSIDGVPVEATANNAAGISDPAVWFYLRGRGRFTLSLVPKPKLGFQKAGEVHDSTLTFRDGAVEYRIECSRRIAPGEGSYNVYVRHEPAWGPPADDPDPFILGAGPLEFPHPK